ncbi:MAG: hypothetical protein Kow00108_12650 [Calditrichia bacterium]
MIKKIWLLFVVSFMFIAFGQNPKIVLLEEATNASCPPCAANNPKLQKFYSDNIGNVISVRYHAWWPGSDPMYSANTTENRARIQYYGINGVPTYVMDGSVKGTPSSPDLMESQMLERLNETPPFDVKVQTSVVEDTLYCTVVVKAVGPGTDGTFMLRNAIVERYVEYSSPPGSNGEKEFECVFRKFLNDATGETITNLAQGDSVVFEYQYTLNSTWSKPMLMVVSWIQNDITKEVLQAAANIDLYSINHVNNENTFDYTESTSGMEEFYIANYNDNPLELQLFVDTLLAHSGWNAQLLLDGAPVDSAMVTINPGDSLFLKLQINSPVPGNASFRIRAKNLNDTLAYAPGIKINVIKTGVDAMIIDADGTYPYEQYFASVLEENGMTYFLFSHADFQTFAQKLDYSAVPVMFWNNGWGFPAFVEGDTDILASYLDNGGNLFIHGQDIGWDIYDTQYGSSGFARTFYETYFQVTYAKDASTSSNVIGVSGDPITSGMDFNLNRSVHGYYPDVLNLNGDNVSAIFHYGNTSEIGGVKVDNGVYKLVYLSFGLEQIPTEEIRNSVLLESMDWFGVITDVDGNKPNYPTSLELHQNYPNPFNPTTTIRYNLPASSKITIEVFDLQGRKVKTLINGVQPAGNHTIQWDGTNQHGNKVSSGIYFYRLKTKDQMLQRKMILIK